MIKIGLDVATNTGIAVIEINEQTQEMERILMLETRELYFKHNVYLQVKAIKELVCDVLSMVNIQDKIVIALERSNYSKHCASIFGEICGMLVFEFINQLPTPPLIMQFSPDEWHKQIHQGRLDRKQWKELSIKTANEKLPYVITSDDQSDAFNIAWYCHLCRNNINIHQQVVEKRQTKRNIEHELVKWYQKKQYWYNKLLALEKDLKERPNHQKAITTQINKARAKFNLIETEIKNLETQRKGVK